MRRMHRTIASIVLVGAPLALGAACFSVDTDRCYACSDPQGSTSGMGGAGGAEPTDPSCVPSAAATPVSDECGVFVSLSGSDAAEGTKAGPVKTLAKAAELAGKKTGSPRIYACAEAFDGQVTVPAGVEVYGGLDCAADWAYVGASKKTQVTAPPDQIALTLSKGSGTTKLYDLDVSARSAMTPGGSSIAALADGVAAVFERCSLSAGDGANGADGVAFMEAAAAGLDGNAGGDACSASVVVSSEGATTMCGDLESAGGLGGVGTPSGSGGDGSDGEPAGTANGGAGEKGAVACIPGLPGDVGVDGVAGAGGTGVGALSPAGYTGAPGADGAAGIPGQGGGGGGGSKGGSDVTKCNGSMAGGASGGSGASGGCGGAGGKGGGAGGSSIAIASLDAKLTFRETTLVAKNGGSGGVGGPGQEGGPGGVNGGLGGGNAGIALLKPGCAGGAGGNGGKGGAGGNGAGGHSVGIAFLGAAPSPDGAIIQKGNGGTGGVPVDPAGQAGAMGMSADALELTPQ